MRKVRAELTAHVGGFPDAVQRALIERCCWLSLRIALMDRKLTEGTFTQIDSNVYLAWVGSLNRTISRLRPAHEASQTDQSAIDDILAEMRRDR